MKTIAYIFICAVLSLSVQSQTNPQINNLQPGSIESIAKLAQKIRPDFHLGAASIGLRPSNPDNEKLAAIFIPNFDITTIGIYMSAIQRESGKYNFESVDYLVNYAEANNIAVYFHPLMGGAEYSPEWINKGSYSKEELEKIMRDRITTILTRYGRKVHYIDVVNEALNTGNFTIDGEFDWRKEDSKGAHIWVKTIGMYQGKKYKFPQYFVDVFRIAREVGDKDLKLILNEFGNATTKSPKGNVFLALIKAMREEGIPVDGAGMQLHCLMKEGKLIEMWGEDPFDFDAFDEMLKKYEQAGIDVHITEFDIHMPENSTEADFQLQGKYYAEILKHCIKSSAVKTFKTWGFTDKYSWKVFKRDSYPLLFDNNFMPKPAYIQQVELLKSLAGVKK